MTAEVMLCAFVISENGREESHNVQLALVGGVGGSSPPNLLKVANLNHVLAAQVFGKTEQKVRSDRALCQVRELIDDRLHD